MALPYPYEVETGRLEPQEPEPRVTFDIQAHVYEAITVSGSGVQLFGVRRELAEPQAAATLVNRFRDTLAQHFLERHPNADSHTWELFVRQAHAQLERGQRVDEGTLTTLLMTVDGL